MDTNTSIYDALDDVKMLFYTYRQDVNDSNDKHLRNFKRIVAAIDHQGGQMFADDALLNHERDVDALQVGIKNRSEDERKLCVREKTMGAVSLKRGKVNYEKLI